MAPQAGRHRLQAGAASILSRHLRRQQRAGGAALSGRSLDVTSSPSSSPSPTAMPPSRTRPRPGEARGPARLPLHMRAAAAVVAWPLPGRRKPAPPWPEARRGPDRPMLAEAVAPERTDRSPIWRMRNGSARRDEVRPSHLRGGGLVDTLSSGTVATLYHLAAHPECRRPCAASCAAKSRTRPRSTSPT